MANNNIDKHIDVDLEGLLSEYLDICNRAMEENKHRFLYKKAIQLNKALLNELNFRTYIYDQHPENIIGEFIVHFDAAETKLELVSSGKQKVDFSWRAPLHYLQDVVEKRPEYYIKKPIMLDWSWIRERLHTSGYGLRKRPRAFTAASIGFLIGATVGGVTAYLLSRSGAFRS